MQFVDEPEDERQTSLTSDLSAAAAAAAAAAVSFRDPRSFEIRLEFELAVTTPLLVVSRVKRLKPSTALSGTVYRLASSMSDHMPVV